MQTLGAEIAKSLSLPSLITLSGELGAGKSVLARSIIGAFGYQGLVKSPTYSLVEQYQVNHIRLAHLDLYRLNEITTIPKGESFRSRMRRCRYGEN